MAALRRVTPAELRRRLETGNYTIIALDDHNWLLAKEPTHLPFLPPHDFPVVLPYNIPQTPEVILKKLDDLNTSDGEFRALLGVAMDYISPHYEDPFC